LRKVNKIKLKKSKILLNKVSIFDSADTSV